MGMSGARATSRPATALPEIEVPAAPEWGRYSFLAAGDGLLEHVRDDEGRAVLVGVRWPTDERGQVRAELAFRGIIEVGVLRLTPAELAPLERMYHRFPRHDFKLSRDAGELLVRPCGERPLTTSPNTSAPAQLLRLARRVAR